MLLKELIDEGISAISQLYPEKEAREMVLSYLESTLGTSRHTHIVAPSYTVSDAAAAAARVAFARMASGEPLQYVVGKAHFYGREFNVGPAVLIPRQETELLCREVCNFLTVRHLECHFDSGEFGACRSDGLDIAPKILDLCTGSGCIAWTLALENPGATVVAADISDGALSVASGQDFDDEIGRTGASAPVFIKTDVLAGPSVFADSFHDSDPVFPACLPSSFDILVSNPPYVIDSEKALMRANVLDYEPHLALFVSDDDPLLFYRSLAAWASFYLRPGGFGIVEINEALGPQTAAIYSAAGFSEISIIKDLNDKDRFVSFRKSSSKCA